MGLTKLVPTTSLGVWVGQDLSTQIGTKAFRYGTVDCNGFCWKSPVMVQPTYKNDLSPLDQYTWYGLMNIENLSPLGALGVWLCGAPPSHIS